MSKKDKFDKTDEPTEKPTEKPTSSAVYVVASGPQIGTLVEVQPVGPTITNPETGDQFTDLAHVGAPDVVYQTKALFSKKKELGTWHYR